MSIIKETRAKYPQEEPQSLASLKQVCSTLSHDNVFVNEILDCFSIENNDVSMKQPLDIGNVKQLLADISKLDEQTKKIDATVNEKDTTDIYTLEETTMCCSTFTA